MDNNDFWDEHYEALLLGFSSFGLYNKQGSGFVPFHPNTRYASISDSCEMLSEISRTISYINMLLERKG